MTRTSAHEPVVHTASGRVRGRIENGVAVFRGIAFAQPPVGEARFARPLPTVPWSGIRDAFEFGPPPPQEPGIAGLTGLSEIRDGDDWLTVNVWTPEADSAALRPVIVWIHGGAYKLGYSGSPGYDAYRNARDGDVVVVTFNYRVGVEGFARISGAPANRGLLDQVAALRWVRANISAFGGDPDGVTVCGESAGAGSVAALLAMPSAAGLFQRAIMQSLPGRYFSDALATDIADVVAKAAGCRPTVADLSEVNPRSLPEAGVAVAAEMRRYAESWGAAAYMLAPFAPVVDGDVLPTTPWQAVANGAARDVDLIVGHNQDECRLFFVLGGQKDAIDDARAEFDLRLYGPGPGSEIAYRAAFPDATPARLCELVQSDNQYRMPAVHLADGQAAAGGRVHMYELTWSAPNNGGVFGACHALDETLLFGTYGTHLGPLLLGPKPPAEAEQLSAMIRFAWARFAATGEPGWPAYDPDRRLIQILDVEPSIARYPEEASRRIWQDYRFHAMPLLQPSQ
ncbi:carboxylesterase/lipase family protein [Nocardia jiangxiensis]|uniref:carboxylesterase/lipase family protein n=1 Tax=Nocardia jiangxiensis TaxID=282685 RepID=UPI0002D66291|nr:carboxylesterase family protein [Nocardia jiangxiensis]